MKSFAGIFTLAALAATAVNAAEYQADVVVYGGTSGGVIAAVAAAANGKSALLIEPGAHLGGMTSGGLGQVDAGREETIGGFTRQYFTRVAETYRPKAALFRVTPQVAEETFDRMAAEHNVTVLKHARLKEGAGVVKAGGAITAVALENGDIVRGKVFIDSSYEGDLMAQAGVAYTVGRESVQTYGESAAGVRQLRELRVAFDERGELLPELVRSEPGRPGEADAKVQAYNFRLCVTAVPANRVPFPKPANYRPDYYRNLLENVLKTPKSDWKFTDFVSLGDLPQGKFDLNNKGWYSTDFVNASWGYPEGSYAEREKLYADHVDYVQGLLYFLVNDPRLPESLRSDAAKWGLAKDEFADNGHFPKQLYIREGRRLLGEYVMTQEDAYTRNSKPDAVAMGSYMLDTHWVQKVLAPNGKVYLEGLLGHLPMRPYEIPYRSIVPKRGECANLLVSTAMSASHVIYSSLRMEPVYMMLGEAAGTAAALAVDAGKPVQEIDVAALQDKLRANRQVLRYPGGNIFPLLPEIPGLVVDDHAAEFTGKWSRSSSSGPYVAGLYAYTPAADTVTATAVYRFEIPSAGTYKLNICYSPVSNRAKAAPIELRVNGVEQQRFTIDMTKRYDGAFFPLGDFKFERGDKVEVVYTNLKAAGLVIADAVQLLPQNPDTVSAAPGPEKPVAAIAFDYYHTAAILAGRALSGPAVAAGVDRAAVVRLADAMLERVLPDGAIDNTNIPAEKVLIIPYFSNFCAIALIQAYRVTGDARYLDAARNWLRWYAAHVQEDGTVHDYKSGTYPDYVDSGDYDSADSYPTTFAYALWFYGQATGDLALARELYPKLQQAMGAALAVRQEDFLTFAKQSYKIKYFMDNIEVWYGVIACAKLEEQLGGSRFDHYADWARRLMPALGGYWIAASNFFQFAPGHLDLKRIYPGALANAFGILFLLPPEQPGVRALFGRIDEVILSRTPVLDSSIQTQVWLLLAAQRIGEAAWEAKLKANIEAKIKPDRERSHALALLLLYHTGGFNGQYGAF
jgi:hypothetical protein